MADKIFAIRSFEAEKRSIPLPIQTYFWRQTSQLLKPKVMKRTYESACVSFERMICDNRIQDLQTRLASAVKSIPRWHFIQSSVPYILQCISTLLVNRTRLGNIERLGNAEKSLLYTLHWILVEAPAVCSVTEQESLLFPLTTIELFVHLLVPHVHTVREDDLTFRLENGFSLWRALWNHATPPFTPFTTPVIHKDDDVISETHAHRSSRDSAIANDFSAASFFDVAVLKCLSTTGWSEEGIVWGLFYLADYLTREFELPVHESQKEADNIPVRVVCHDPSHASLAEGQPSEREKMQKDAQQRPGMPQEKVEEDGMLSSDMEQTPIGTKLRVRVQSSPVLTNGGRVFAAVASRPVKRDVTQHALREGKALSDSAVIIDAKVIIRPASPVVSREDESKSSTQLGGCNQMLEDVITLPSRTRAVGSLLIPGAPIPKVSSELVEESDTVPSTQFPLTTATVKTEAGLPNSSISSGPRTGEDPLTSVSSAQLVAQVHDAKDGGNVFPSTNASPQNQRNLPTSTGVGDHLTTTCSKNRDSYVYMERYHVYPGTAEYITNDGRLSTVVILQALNDIITEHPTSHVCDAVLRVFYCLVKIDDKRRDGVCSVDDRTVSETQALGYRSPHSDNILGRLRASFYGQPPSFQSLAMGCTFRLIKALGCPLGCGEGCRGITGEKLRKQTNSLLSRLLKEEEEAITSWLQQYAKLEPAENQVDFLHALLGFCEDVQDLSDDEAEGERPTVTLFRVPEGVEGVIVGRLFKTLVTRVAEMSFQDLKHLTFYGEIRQLLKYVKENFGGVFWEVALSGLIDSICKEPIWSDQPQTLARNVETTQRAHPLRRLSSSAKDDKTTTPKGKRKFLFQKISRGNGGSEVDNSSVAPSSSQSVSSVVDLPSVKATMSPKSKRKIFTLGSWRKQKAIGTPYNSDDELLEFGDASSNTTPSGARQRTPKQKCSRKTIEDVFPVTIPHRMRADDGYLPAPMECERKPVDVDGLRAGMFSLRFLLNGLQPGSVPDPKIVASMLDLEAPVVSRACLLLECAHLVHRCNKRDWPQWLRGTLPYLSHNRKAQSPKANMFMFTHRKNLLAMHEAGKLFQAWGVALGLKLQQVMKKDSGLMPEDEDGTWKTQLEVLAEEEASEDFLDEATLTETCPYALKMVACQLLLEITSFLCETHEQLSLGKETTRTFQPRTINRKRQSLGSRRRSTAFVPEPGSRASGYFGGGGERIRKASIMSQTSFIGDFTTAANRRSITGPPIITVSGELAERKGDGLLGPKNASSLFVTRAGGHQRRPSRKRNAVGGEGDILRHRTKRGYRGNRLSAIDPTYDEDEESDEDESTKFPWLHAIVQLNSVTSFICEHQGACPASCYQRQSRGCSRLTSALKVVYAGVPQKRDKGERSRGDKGAVSGGSPRISSPKSGLRSGEQKSKKDKPDEEMLSYIDTKVSGLTHCPLSVIAKAGVVMDTNLLLETLPISWQLLLNDDQQLVSAAAAVFLLTGVRLRDTVEKMLHNELTCPHPDDRMKSLLRYEVLWHSRYHAWPRLKEGARQDLKVPPPKVDFTLPSPAVGIPAQQAPDCPWNPLLTLEEQQSLKEKESKKVKEIPDEERARQLRSDFPLRTVAVSIDATTGVDTNDDEKGETQQVDAELWPPAVSSAVPDIIRMMDDVLVDSNRTAVMEAAVRVVWTCLVNDPVLFFRIILEQLTKQDKQEERIALLRKLLLYVIQLPPTSSRFLVNNLIGVAMFYARTNKPGTQDSVALVLSLLWELVPSVRGLYFKDLKQCLKKEFIDAALRVSANVPGAKRLAISFPGQEDTLERISVHEEMTFGKVLSYYKTRLRLHATDLYLIDKRSNQILEERLYVRDMFQYRKGFPSPQLIVEHLDFDKAFSRRQEQAFTTKLSDIGRILLTTSILKAQPSQKHVSFLHDEFSRQISFPRKALDCDFELYTAGAKGKELAALDVIHKGYWVQMICLLFDCMPSDFPWGKADLHLFLNVLNGAVLLHCEDTAMLRLCLSSFINVAIHFSHIFSTDGYQCIFPSLLQVYSQHQSNGMVTAAIEFTLSQLYTLHQKPCLLQLLASVAPILLLENKETGNNEQAQTENQDSKIPPNRLFSLLVSLDKPTMDVLEILELVKAEKPLKPMDSCYENTVDTVGDSKVDEVIRLCVTVVNFAPESKRAMQMVVVLSAILPHYVEHLKCDSSGVGLLSEDKMKVELAALTSLATSMQVLIKSCEVFTRSFVHLQSYKSMSDKTGILADLASTTASIGPYLGPGSFSSVDGGDETDEMKSRSLLERIRAQEEKDEVMEALEQFRKPRDALLLLVSEYVRLCSPRVQELRHILPPRLNAPELLDSVCIMTVAEIAYALLKVAVYDARTLASPGVHRYIIEALPVMEGPSDVLDSSMLLMLKRAQKIFQKLVSKPSLARFLDWKSLEVFLDGLHMVLCKQTSIAFSHYLKSIVTECMCLVLQERSITTTSVAANLPFAPFFSPPHSFCDMVIKLASRLMFELRAECTLKELCGGIANFGSPARTEKVFARVILPILVRLGSGRTGAPKASSEDVAFALTCFLQIVTTKSKYSPTLGPHRLSLAEDDLDLTRTLAFVRPHIAGESTEDIPSVVYHLAYLGIKLLMVCFEDLLSTEWYRIYQALEVVAETAICGVAFWDFIHFAVSHRTPLFLLLMPVITTKIIHIPHANNTERALKQRILSKVHRPPPVVSCRNVYIRRFLDDIAALKQKHTTPEQDLEEEELVLKDPPTGKKINADVEEPDNHGELSKLKRGASPRSKKAVSFTPSASHDTQVDSKLSTGSESSTHGAKRSRRVLHKQESFETADNAGEEDSSDTRLGHQREGSLKGSYKKKPGVSGFKAAAVRLMREDGIKMSENKTNASRSETRSDARNSARSENETKVEMRDIEVGEDAPIWKNSMPPSKETAPTQKSTNTTSKETAPTQKDTNATSKETAPTQKATNTTSKETAPTQKATNTTSKETAPTQKATKTTSKETAPTQKATNTTSKETAPTPKVPNTTSQETAPTQKDTNTTSKETAPTQKDTNTTSKETAPTQKDTNTTSKGTAPTQKDTNTTSKETAPTQKDTNTTSKGTAPTQKDTNTTSKESAPTQKDTNTTSKETVPTKKASNIPSQCAPLATPESLSPATSVEGRDRLIPPASPVKGGEFYGDTNGSLTSKATPALNQDRATRLGRTRMWHRVYTENYPTRDNAMEIEPNSPGGHQSRHVSTDSENERETNV